MIARRMEMSEAQKGRRRAARVALYGSLLLVAGTAVGLARLIDRPPAPRATEQWIETDYLNLPEVKVFQKYVQIDTSRSTGDEVAGARFLAAQLEAAGIPTEIEILGNGRHANLYAWLHGKDPHPLVLHNHIDVQDVDPSEWFVPPFEGRIDLPWIYGRGVFDMKSVAIAQLQAMIDLKKSGRPLARSVLFLATSSEENGSQLGVRWIIRSHPELVKSFWAVLTEGGVVEARTRDDIKYWGTEVAQKRFADLIVCSDDRARLEEVERLVREAGPTETDLVLTPEARALFEHYGPTRDHAELRRLLANPEIVLGDRAEFRKLSPYLRSMYRNEAVPFGIREVPGGGFELTLKLHLLPRQELTPALVDRLVPPWMTFGLDRRLEVPPAAMHGSPTDHPAFTGILETIHEDFPKAPAGPYFQPWSANDARFFRTLDVPSYGFSPFLILTTDTLQVDRANERIALPGFVQGVGLYTKLVRRLVSDT